MARMGRGAANCCWGATILLSAGLAGCDPSASNPGAGGANVTQNPFSTPSGNVPIAEPATTEVKRSGPAATAAQPVFPAPTTALAIRLSAGTALPQTGPEGTLMSFSVDYRVSQGRPEPTSKFMLVVSGSGKSVQQPLTLKPEGTVEFLTPNLRPEDGPFSAHIIEITVDGSRQDLSPSVPLL